MDRLRPAFKTLVLSLANGYILCFYSERLFWAMSRPGDRLADLALALVAYSLAGYLLLALVQWLRIGTWYALLIAGAIFGWLIEGVWANTLFGTEDSSPFPLSILVTAVNWHSLITVLVGWWLIPLTLHRLGTAWTIVASLGLGLFWGAWAIFERFESPPIVPSVASFALHAFVTTILLAVCYWLLTRWQVWTFHPSRAGLIVVVALHIAWFVTINVVSLGLGGFAVILLVILLAASCMILWAGRPGDSEETALDTYRGAPPLARYAMLLLAPASATGFYALTLPAGSAVPPLHQVIFIGSVIAAAGGTVAALCFVIRDMVRKNRSFV